MGKNKQFKHLFKTRKNKHFINKKHKKKVKKTDFKDFNWSSQNYYNQNQLDKIFDGIQIVKQVKTKDETKKLSKDPYLDLYNFTK